MRSILLLLAFVNGVRLTIPDVCSSLLNSGNSDGRSTNERSDGLKSKRSVRLDEKANSGFEDAHFQHLKISNLTRSKRALLGTHVYDMHTYKFDFFVYVILEMLPADGKRKVKRHCGGALLSPGWVITSENCLRDQDGNFYKDNVTVIAGVMDLKDAVEDNYFYVEYLEQIPHSFPVDLMLINLKRTTRYVNATPIHVQDDVSSRFGCAIGREKTYEFLRVFNERIRISHESPGKVYLQMNNGGLCAGDSGSPLISFDSERKMFLLEGILSSADCENNTQWRNTYEHVLPHFKHLAKIIPSLQPPENRRSDFWLPFNMGLGAPINVGERLFLEGRFNDDAEVFEIDFLSVIPRSSVVTVASILHLKIDFAAETFLSNYMEEYVWSNNPTTIKSPFKKGDTFQIMLLVLERTIEVRANHAHAFTLTKSPEFLHSEHLSVDGDATITALHLGRRFFTNGHNIRFSRKHGLFTIGSVLRFYVISKGDWKLNFRGEKETDILFHASIRFGEKSPTGTDGVIVRNFMHWETGKFGEQEERDGRFPFQLDVGSNVTITNKLHHIEFEVNGKTIFNFKHKIDFPESEYKEFNVYGNAFIMDVELGKTSRTRRSHRHPESHSRRARHHHHHAHHHYKRLP